MAVSLNRTFEIDGRYYVFKYKQTYTIEELDKDNPILESDELTAFPEKELPAEKIFTWIFGVDEDGKEKLYAREAKNTLELFSKHISILGEVNINPEKFDTKPITLKYAGEMKITIDAETHILFNLSSGTYMTHYTLAESLTIGEKLRGTFSELFECDVQFAPNIETMIQKTPNLTEIFRTNTVDIFEFDSASEAFQFMNAEHNINKLIAQIDQLGRAVGVYKTDMKLFDERMSGFVTEKTKLEKLLQKTPWMPRGGRKSRRKGKKNRRTRRNLI
jgi:hypothetical protein